MRPIFPYRWWQVLGIAAVTAAVTASQAIGHDRWAPVRWTEVSADARESLLLVAPLTMATAAWAASVRHTAAAGVAPGRPWAAIARRHALVLGGATLAGYLTGLLPGMLLAATRASAGGPDLLVYASGIVAVPMFFAAGYLVGLHRRAPMSLAMAFALGFVLTGGIVLASDLSTSAGSSTSLLSVSPFWSIVVTRGWHEAADVSGFRVIFFVTVGAAFWVCAMHSVERLGRTTRETVRQSGVVVAVPAILGLTSLISQPVLTEPDRSPDVSCADRSHIELCMYAEEQSLLQLTLDEIAQMVDRFGPGAFSGVATSVVAPHLPPDTPDSDFVFVPQTQESEVYYAQVLRDDLAMTITGAAACTQLLHERFGADYPLKASPQALESEVVARLLSASISERMGGQAETGMSLPDDPELTRTRQLVDSIDRLTDHELRDRIEASAPQLATCRTNADALLAPSAP